MLSRLGRQFSKKLQKGGIFEKLEQARKEIMEEKDIERYRKDMNNVFPDQTDELDKRFPKIIEQKPQSTPSLFGQSSEEDPEPLFLEDLEQTQYIYQPKQQLEFDEQGKCLIWDGTWPRIFPKIRSARKLIFVYGLAVFYSVQPFIYSSFTIGLFWLLPMIYTYRALLVQKIYLDQNGQDIEIHYKRHSFGRTKQMRMNINLLKLPSGDKFGLWNAYEFPDDLRTYMENEKMQRILFAKKIENSWSFLLMPKNPDFVNREVLVNIFNNIYIDTKNIGGEDITQRYYIYND